MQKNFAIVDGIAVQNASGYYDLHNYFSLSEMIIDFPARQVDIRFYECGGTQGNSPGKSVTLRFSEVDYIQFSSGILTQAEPNLVLDIGYKAPEDFDYDWFKAEQQANPDDHLVIRLDGDEIIRLHGKSVEMYLNDVAR